jgi:hypothetical protein
MIKRHIISSLLEALSDTPVVLLTGARQTGKSTLVKAIAPDYHPARYITLDNLSMLAAVRQDPAGFLAGLDGNFESLAVFARGKVGDSRKVCGCPFRREASYPQGPRRRSIPDPG